MKRLFILPAMLFALAGAGACSSDSKTDLHAGENQAHETGHDPDEIHFSSEQARSAGLETEVAVPGRFSGVIRTSGQILPAAGDEQTVVAASNGVVTLVSGDIVPGKQLSSGQTFATISARNLSDGDPVAKARIAYETARKEFDRAQSLVRDQIISDKNFEQARLAYETAKAAYEAFDGHSGAAGVRVCSPLNGYVKQLLVASGEYVSVGQTVAVVSQNRRLQLRAEVSENYFNRLKGIRSANFRPSYENTVYSLSELGGRLVSYGRASGDRGFYLPVTFEFNNTGNFIAGSFAEIYLLDAEREGVISIPEAALTEEQGVYFVYLKLDEEGYKKQEVRLGADNGLRREIVAGLKAGDEVVTRCAYQVKLASMAGTVPEGHSHSH